MVNYSIVPTGDGYKLTVWEPAPITIDRLKPFAFKVNYIISSPLEALALVKLIQGTKVVARSRRQFQVEPLPKNVEERESIAS
jgi:hypothetical protein